MIRPFTSTGFLSKIHWHSTSMDFEEFYRDHIPKACLPSDYGGYLESVAELHQKHKKLLHNMNDYFILEEKQSNLEFEDLDVDSLNL